MKRRALLLAPLAILGVKPSDLVSRGSYQFKPAESERFAAVLAANERRIAEHNARVGAHEFTRIQLDRRDLVIKSSGERRILVRHNGDILFSDDGATWTLKAV